MGAASAGAAANSDAQAAAPATAARATRELLKDEIRLDRFCCFIDWKRASCGVKLRRQLPLGACPCGHGPCGRCRNHGAFSRRETHSTDQNDYPVPRTRGPITPGWLRDAI